MKEKMMQCKCGSVSFDFDAGLNAYCQKCGKFHKVTLFSAPKEKTVFQNMKTADEVSKEFDKRGVGK